MTKIGAEYRFDGDIKKWHNALGKILQVKKDSSVKIDWYSVYGGTSSGFLFEIIGDPEDVREATKKIIDGVGVPYFARSGTDYNLFDEILKEYGMKTSRKFRGGGVGRWICPIKT